MKQFGLLIYILSDVVDQIQDHHCVRKYAIFHIFLSFCVECDKFNLINTKLAV